MRTELGHVRRLHPVDLERTHRDLLARVQLHRHRRARARGRLADGHNVQRPPAERPKPAPRGHVRPIAPHEHRIGIIQNPLADDRARVRRVQRVGQIGNLQRIRPAGGHVRVIGLHRHRRGPAQPRTAAVRIVHQRTARPRLRRIGYVHRLQGARTQRGHIRPIAPHRHAVRARQPRPAAAAAVRIVVVADRARRYRICRVGQIDRLQDATGYLVGVKRHVRMGPFHVHVPRPGCRQRKAGHMPRPARIANVRDLQRIRHIGIVRRHIRVIPPHEHARGPAQRRSVLTVLQRPRVRRPRRIGHVHDLQRIAPLGGYVRMRAAHEHRTRRLQHRTALTVPQRRHGLRPRRIGHVHDRKRVRFVQRQVRVIALHEHRVRPPVHRKPALVMRTVRIGDRERGVVELRRGRVHRERHRPRVRRAQRVRGLGANEIRPVEREIGERHPRRARRARREVLARPGRAGPRIARRPGVLHLDAAGVAGERRHRHRLAAPAGPLRRRQVTVGQQIAAARRRVQRQRQRPVRPRVARNMGIARHRRRRRVPPRREPARGRARRVPAAGTARRRARKHRARRRVVRRQHAHDERALRRQAPAVRGAHEKRVSVLRRVRPRRERHLKQRPRRGLRRPQRTRKPTRARPVLAPQPLRQQLHRLRLPVPGIAVRVRCLHDQRRASAGKNLHRPTRRVGHQHRLAVLCRRPRIGRPGQQPPHRRRQHDAQRQAPTGQGPETIHGGLKGQYMNIPSDPVRV